MRVNGKIRAREVRIIGVEGNQLGVFPLHEAINMARSQGVDLVEIAPNAAPPVCRLVDFGKFRYEQAKKEKEARKRQHATKVKEVQLSPSIDPHDFQVKLSHGIDFLCDEMKVKVTLRFRGREMAHKEFGFQIVNQFINALAAYGHPDAPPKLVGKGIVLMLSPLPRNKRGKNPHQPDGAPAAAPKAPPAESYAPPPPQPRPQPQPQPVPAGNGGGAGNRSGGFSNNPFAEIELKVGQ